MLAAEHQFLLDFHHIPPTLQTYTTALPLILVISTALVSPKPSLVLHWKNVRYISYTAELDLSPVIKAPPNSAFHHRVF
jgi:hypothetical protein